MILDKGNGRDVMLEIVIMMCKGQLENRNVIVEW